MSAQDAATVDIWFYEHVLPEGVKNYTKTRPMTFEEFAPLLVWWAAREVNERAWKVRAADLIPIRCQWKFVEREFRCEEPQPCRRLGTFAAR